MNVTRLKLANLRAIGAAEFKFQPGFNLIVGVNGVGKTSVLDALAVCLSAITRQVNHIRTSVEGFVADDIRVGGDALTIECGFTYGGDAYTYLIHKPRASSVPQQQKTGQPREQVHDTPERAEYIGATPKPLDGTSEKAAHWPYCFLRGGLYQLTGRLRRGYQLGASQQRLVMLLPIVNYG